MKGSRVHFWATILWATVGSAITIWKPHAVWWVALMSLWANVVSHWGAYESSRAKEEVEKSEGD